METRTLKGQQVEYLYEVFDENCVFEITLVLRVEYEVTDNGGVEVYAIYVSDAYARREGLTTSRNARGLAQAFAAHFRELISHADYVGAELPMVAIEKACREDWEAKNENDRTDELRELRRGA